MAVKPCTKCGEKKPIIEFHKTNQIKSGYSTWCEVCYKEYHASYSITNSEVAKKRAKKHYNEHKEKHLADIEIWKKNNAEKVREIKRQWKLRNPDVEMEHCRARRARLKGSGGVVSKQEWNELKNKYDYTCLCCGKKEPEIKLTLDHVSPISRGGMNVISNAQPLCQPCNSSKNTKTIDYRPLEYVAITSIMTVE